ncbi:UNVERIFIED_CONTAM: hypothetical protein Sradi_2511200 [Sesamum radiatum]|uniref:Reverse transcriptase domain-containing protein n=1 Tax=Sesamum radiatum TaxID=300843 RepID=A0AAW2SL89_SESRA
MKEERERHTRPKKEHEPPCRPKFHKYTPLATIRTKALMMVERSNMLQWPRLTRFTPTKKYSNKYYKFHRERGHDTEDCYQLKDEIERLVRQGYFKEYVLKQEARQKDYSVGDRRTRCRGKFHDRECKERKDKGERENAPVKGVINSIAGGPLGGDSKRTRNNMREA